MVICLERGADMHMADATATHCVLSFWYRLTWIVLEKGPFSRTIQVSRQSTEGSSLYIHFGVRLKFETSVSAKDSDPVYLTGLDRTEIVSVNFETRSAVLDSL